MAKSLVGSGFGAGVGEVMKIRPVKKLLQKTAYPVGIKIAQKSGLEGMGAAKQGVKLGREMFKKGMDYPKSKAQDFVKSKPGPKAAKDAKSPANTEGGVQVIDHETTNLILTADDALLSQAVSGPGESKIMQGFAP